MNFKNNHFHILDPRSSSLKSRKVSLDLRLLYADESANLVGVTEIEFATFSSQKANLLYFAGEMLFLARFLRF